MSLEKFISEFSTKKGKIKFLSINYLNLSRQKDKLLKELMTPGGYKDLLFHIAYNNEKCRPELICKLLNTQLSGSDFKRILNWGIHKKYALKLQKAYLKKHKNASLSKYLNLAIQTIEQCDIESLHKDLEAKIQKKLSKSRRLLPQMGEYYECKGDLEQAINFYVNTQQYKKATEIGRNNNKLEIALIKMQNSENYISCHKVEIAELLIELNRKEEAIEILDTIGELDLKSKEILELPNIVKIYVNNGYKNKAIELLKKCNAYEGNHIYIFNLAKSYNIINNSEKSKEYAKKLTDKFIDSSELYEELISWADKAGYDDIALQACKIKSTKTNDLEIKTRMFFIKPDKKHGKKLMISYEESGYYKDALKVATVLKDSKKINFYKTILAKTKKKLI